MTTFEQRTGEEEDRALKVGIVGQPSLKISVITLFPIKVLDGRSFVYDAILKLQFVVGLSTRQRKCWVEIICCFRSFEAVFIQVFAPLRRDLDNLIICTLFHRQQAEMVED